MTAPSLSPGVRVRGLLGETGTVVWIRDDGAVGVALDVNVAAYLPFDLSPVEAAPRARSASDDKAGA